MFVFIDSAVTGCNIAMAGETGVLAMHQESITRGHAEFIVPQFQKMLAECKKTAADINEIIVTVGPGSFTGLRVGVTMAQTMGYALGKPVRGVSSFQTFSCAINNAAQRMVVVDTKRDDYYVQILNSDHQPIADAQCISAANIQNLLQANMVITGDAVTKLSNDIDLSMHETVQQDMIDLDAVVEALMNGQLDFVKADAFYIRDADVSQPKATTK